MLEAWEFITRRPELLAGWVLAHLWIIFVAVIIAIVLGVTLGIYITGKGREHLSDTVLYLAEIVMTIPSLDSLDARLFGETWIGYEVPRHLHLFPLDTLSSFLRQKGFEILDARNLYGSYHAFFASLQFYLRDRDRPQLARLAAKNSKIVLNIFHR